MGCGNVSDNCEDSRNTEIKRKSILLIYLIEDKIEKRKKSYEKRPQVVKKKPARQSTTES